MGKLQQFRGHFLNWYDTKTLQPLFPRYVSSVDSGNLAAHLITAKNACLAQLDEPLAHWKWLEGLHDALMLLKHACAENGACGQLMREIDAFAESLQRPVR